MTARKSTDDRRTEIKQATLALAFQHGPGQVTTGMIAARLGLTQPAIYRHFPRKDDLWQSIAQDLCARIARTVADAVAQSTSLPDRLRRLVTGHLKLIHEAPALPEIMVMRDQNNPQAALRQEILSSMAGFTQAMLGTITEAQETGTFRADIDARDIATLTLGVIQSLVLRLLVTRDPSVLLHDFDRLLDLQLSIFTRKAGHA
jgi:AcrR family transcriptional regulator